MNRSIINTLKEEIGQHSIETVREQLVLAGLAHWDDPPTENTFREDLEVEVWAPTEVIAQYYNIKANNQPIMGMSFALVYFENEHVIMAVLGFSTSINPLGR